MSSNTITDRQLAANRENAKKSTGPRTPEGKLRSRLNATTHGLTAKCLVFDNDPDESLEAFMTLEAELVADLKPVGRLEHLLVQRIAVVHWRFNRAYRYEAAGVTSARGHFANYRDQHEPYADPSWIVLPEDDDLDKLLRYEGMLDRELNRTLNQLTRLQFLRLRRDEDTDPDDGQAPADPTAIRAPTRRQVPRTVRPPSVDLCNSRPEPGA